MQRVIADVAIASMPTFCFFIMLDSKTQTAINIDVKNIQMVLTPEYLDEETVAAAIPNKYSLLNLHGAPPLIQLPQRDDAILETWDVKHVGDLDLPYFCRGM
jgi:hypothetical protein